MLRHTIWLLGIGILMFFRLTTYEEIEKAMSQKSDSVKEIEKDEIRQD